ASHGDLAIEEVDHKRSASIVASPSCRVEAPQFGDTHARRQIPGAKGTREIVGIQIENGDAVRLAIAAAYGDEVSIGICALDLAQLIEIEPRKIDHDDIERPIRLSASPENL